MTRLTHRLRLPSVRKVALRSALAFAGLQASVVAGLVITDALEKRKRVRRSGFPHPGTFDCDVAGNGVAVYTYGEDLYRDMLAAIEGAERQILFETFLWKNDDVGRAFRDALNAAAARGVDVYVIHDGFGNLVVPPSFFRFHPAVKAFRFPPVKAHLLHAPLRAAGVTHRKLLVVDRQIGFSGGFNIGSLYATEWRDTHARVTGPAVFELEHAFSQVWNHLAARHPELTPTDSAPWSSPLRMVCNVPADIAYPIRGLYLDAISRARHHVQITTPYFIPDQQILHALIEASRRGVAVQVMLPEESNHLLADWLSRGFYSTLLAEGIEVLLYRDAMIHAKTATIDGQWSIVGTANIDRLSLRVNYEADLEIRDPEFAAGMERVFAADSDNCRRLDRGEWGRRHPAARFAETVLVPLRPFL